MIFRRALCSVLRGNLIAKDQNESSILWCQGSFALLQCFLVDSDATNVVQMLLIVTKIFHRGPLFCIARQSTYHRFWSCSRRRLWPHNTHLQVFILHCISNITWCDENSLSIMFQSFIQFSKTCFHLGGDYNWNIWKNYFWCDTFGWKLWSKTFQLQEFEFLVESRCSSAPPLHHHPCSSFSISLCRTCKAFLRCNW